VTARGWEGPVAGAVLALLGLAALREGRRLHTLRETLVAGAVVGDDTFPLIVGAALVVLGAYMILLARLPPVRVEFPRGEIRTRMLVGAAVLAAYWVLAPRLGYTASTALVATALFRSVGGYGWPRALVCGAVATGTLYLVFRVWLREPLPSGLLGG
jgi:hypothetical protein